MIVKNNLGNDVTVSGVYYGKLIIKQICYSTLVLWRLLKSCFSSGTWISDSTWISNENWKS